MITNMILPSLDPTTITVIVWASLHWWGLVFTSATVPVSEHFIQKALLWKLLDLYLKRLCHFQRSLTF